MGLEEKMTLTQLAKHATKTIDGTATYCVLLFVVLVCSGIIFSNFLAPEVVSSQLTNKVIEFSIFSILTTPVTYLGLAYFSSSSRFSEIANALIIISENGYLIARFFS